MLDDLRARVLKFHSPTEAIDTATLTGRAMWQMIGVLAEWERTLIPERTSAGSEGREMPGRKVCSATSSSTRQRKHGM